LEVTADNRPATRLYKSVGFVSVEARYVPFEHKTESAEVERL
jgi:ribosomal protein S18 acetylase RimI-like enzyme